MEEKSPGSSFSDHFSTKNVLKTDLGRAFQRHGSWENRVAVIRLRRGGSCSKNFLVPAGDQFPCRSVDRKIYSFRMYLLTR